MANKYENAENIGKLVSGGTLSELGKKVNASEKKMSEILKKLSDMESAIQAAKKQEEERIALEQAERDKAEKEAAKAAQAAEVPAPEEKPAAKAEPEKAPAPDIAKIVNLLPFGRGASSTSALLSNPVTSNCSSLKPICIISCFNSSLGTKTKSTFLAHSI